jgi:hypothetical protein
VAISLEVNEANVADAKAGVDVIVLLANVLRVWKIES